MNHLILPTMEELILELDKAFITIGGELDKVGQSLIDIYNKISFNQYTMLQFTESIQTIIELIKLQLYHSTANSILIIILFIIVLWRRTNKNG